MISHHDVANRFCIYTECEFFKTPRISEKDLKIIESFMVLVEKKIGLTSLGSFFLDSYFTYQFQYWKQIKHRPVVYYPVHWILGKKALGRWLGLKYKPTQFLVNQKQQDQYVNLIEESYKKENYSIEDGFYNCLQTTTLFDPKSRYCNLCVNSAVCKKTLQNNFPSIYLKRCVC